MDSKGNCVQECCPVNEQFKVCGGCDKSCADPDRPCQEVCISQCECKEGFFRNEKGICVRKRSK